MVTISEDVLNLAKALNAAGDIAGAYQVLADAGDNYALAAKNIVDGNYDVFEGTVHNLWENQSPGSVDAYWTKVATLHQKNYLQLISDNAFSLPDTAKIEASLPDVSACWREMSI